MADIFRQVSLSEELVYLQQRTCTQDDSHAKTPSSAQPISDDHCFIKEQAQEEGYKIGFMQGLAEGCAQGEKQAEKQVSELAAQLQTLLQTIPLALNEGRRALKTEIADIVLAIIQQLFIHQQHNKEAIAQQINSTLKHLNDQQAITLTLNHQDLILLQQGEIKIDFSQFKDLRIAADESLSIGGCRIKTEHGIFDASIERQIERLKQVLLEIKQGTYHG